MHSLKIEKENLRLRKMLVVCILTSLIMIPLINALIMNHPTKSPLGEETATEMINDLNGGLENFMSGLNANEILLSTSKALMSIGGTSGSSRVLTFGKFRETLKKKDLGTKVSIANQEQVSIINHGQGQPIVGK